MTYLESVTSSLFVLLSSLFSVTLSVESALIEFNGSLLLFKALSEESTFAQASEHCRLYGCLSSITSNYNIK